MKPDDHLRSTRAMYFRACTRGLCPAPDDDLAGHVVRYDGRMIPIHKAKQRIKPQRVPRSITSERKQREDGFRRRWNAWAKMWDHSNWEQWPTSRHRPRAGVRRPTADRMMAIAASTFLGLAHSHSTAVVKKSALVGIGNWRPVPSRLRYQYKPSDHQLADGAKETPHQRRTPMSIDDVAEFTMRVPPISASRDPMWHPQLIVEMPPPKIEAPPKTKLPMSHESKTRPINHVWNPATLPTSPAIWPFGSLKHKMVDTLPIRHPFGMRAGDMQRAVGYRMENAQGPPMKMRKLCHPSERIQFGGIAPVRTVQEHRLVPLDTLDALDMLGLLDLTIDRWGADGPCSAGGMPERKDIPLRLQASLKHNAASLAAEQTGSRGKKRGAEDGGGPRKSPSLAATTQQHGKPSSSHVDTFQRTSVHLSDYRTLRAPTRPPILFP
ncbi:hypothetical protein CcaverHIS002_0606180 [Cutaneotrichosporon cavernicola]|nr:hypothetical protein CcaverHIS002_0606180 [Cutaneotrichosporon cavernicola]